MPENQANVQPQPPSLRELIKSNDTAHIEEKKMAELMRISLSGLPGDIMGRLREIDKGQRETTGAYTNGIKNLAI